MSNRKKPTDPRRAGGDIAGPGGPHDRNGVVLDTSKAILMSEVEVCTVELYRGLGTGQEETDVGISMLLTGRINKTSEHARILYLLDSDGAAAIISELFAVAYRQGQPFADDLWRRVEALVEDGNMTGRDDGPDPEVGNP